MRTQLPSVLLATALACTYFAAPAQAQSPRTFVSAAGNDSNPCSFAAPCRHFQAAVNATSLGGEVDALDPAGYGPIIISQAVTIEGQGWSYIAPPTNGNGITINAVSGNVAIHGISLNGVGISNSAGIVFGSGDSLEIRDSVIRNCASFGISITPNALSKFSISNTLVSNNAIGIEVEPSGSVTFEGVLDHVRMENNGSGVRVLTMFGSHVILMVSDSVSANNFINGLDIQTNGASESDVMVRNSTITNNGNAGLHTNETGVFVRVSRSTIVRNTIGWEANNGAVVTSYGDNNIDNNGSANSEPPGALVYH
jgi:hypothetical protein